MGSNLSIATRDNRFKTIREHNKTVLKDILYEDKR